MEVRKLKPDELQHHGVKGMKWGVRRYQNPDGSLTADGKAHYNKAYSKDVNRLKKKEKRRNILILKANKRQMKADKFKDKGYRAWTESSAERYKSKAFKQQRKSSRLQYKATKTYNSGIKYYKKMEKKYAEIPMSTFNKEDIAYGKRYVQRVLY